MVPDKKITIFADGEFTQLMYLSVLEVLGETEFNLLIESSTLKVDNRDDPTWKPITIDQLNSFLNVLVNKYGLLSARGFVLLTGRATFRNLRRRNQDVQEIGSIQHRLEPFSTRIFLGLRDCIKLLQDHLTTPIQLIETTPGWQVEFNDGINSELMREINAFSFFLKGILQEFLEWMDPRRKFKVEELNPSQVLSHNSGFLIHVLPMD